VACYGTLLVIGALSLLGVSLAVNTGVWAGTIVFFAAVAVVGVGLAPEKIHRLGTLGAEVRHPRVYCGVVGQIPMPRSDPAFADKWFRKFRQTLPRCGA
jgi:hypothetical protein